MNDKVKILVAVLLVGVAIYGYYYLQDFDQIYRVLIVVGGIILAAFPAVSTEAGKNALSFIKSANIERQKVVWPSRQEALQVTFMVIVLVIILGLLMWIFDWISFAVIYDLILQVRSG